MAACYLYSACFAVHCFCVVNRRKVSGADYILRCMFFWLDLSRSFNRNVIQLGRCTYACGIVSLYIFSIESCGARYWCHSGWRYKRYVSRNLWTRIFTLRHALCCPRCLCVGSYPFADRCAVYSTGSIKGRRDIKP